jgi:colicin import membrane protein
MPRKLKSYVTSLGFFDQAIAAPSMKAALAAWGADSNLFHQGVARETDDPDVVTATMAHPGVVLKRPVGSDGPFREHAELPRHLSGEGREGEHRPKKAKPPPKISDRAARKAALAFEKTQRQRERERREEAKQREREQRAIAKAQAAFDEAHWQHEQKVRAIEAEHERRSKAEDARWERQRQRLDSAIRRAK